MMPRVLFRETLVALNRNRLRTALTSIGVIIGVGSLVVVSAVNSGANKLIERKIAEQGANVIIVSAVKVENTLRRGAAVILTDQDAFAIREFISGIQYISREIFSNATVVAGNMSWITQYWAVDASYEQVFGVKLSEGRFFDEAETRSGAKVVVIGATVAKALFGDESPLDRMVRLDAMPVRVIGVRMKRGSFGGIDEDNFIILPITTARAHIPNSEMSSLRQLNVIEMKVSPDAHREKVKADIVDLLRQRKRLRVAQEDKFDVIDVTQMIQLLDATQSTLKGLLLATATILLIVGGVGIMNIMLVSVTERTREIGIRIALGARRRDILLQFLAEGVALCILAGAIGLAIGVAASVLVARLVDWPLIISPMGVAGATIASVGVGVIFGYLPARRAAGLNPIDALRRG